MTKSLVHGVLVAGCLFITGCCVHHVYRYLDDPEKSSYVHITDIGASITLEDGRVLRLAGLDTSALSPEQLAAFHSAAMHELENSYLVGATHPVLVRAEPGGVRVAIVRQSPPHGGFALECEMAWLGVTTIEEAVEPSKVDLGLSLVQSGLVPAAPGELADPALAELYKEAQEQAKARGLGIWAKPGL